MLLLVSHFIYFLFIPCGRLSWLPVSLLLHFKYTLSYRIVSYRKNYRAEDRARSYDASAGACVSWTRETSGQTTGRQQDMVKIWLLTPRMACGKMRVNINSRELSEVKSTQHTIDPIVLLAPRQSDLANVITVDRVSSSHSIKTKVYWK